MRSLAIPLVALLAAFCAEPAPTDFHVAPDGNDAGPNSKMQPFATLNRAPEAVRALAAAGLKKDFTVYLRGGRYELTGPFFSCYLDSF